MKMVSLSSSDVGEDVKQEFFDMLKKSKKTVVPYVCPWCLTKQISVSSSREKIVSDAELKIKDQEKHIFDRNCISCGRFMIEVFELDMSGFEAMVRGTGIN